MTVVSPLQEYLSLDASMVFASKLAGRSVDAVELAKLCLDCELDVFGRLTGSVELYKGQVDDGGVMYVGDTWFSMEAASTTVGCDGTVYELVRNGFVSGLLRHLESKGDLSEFDPTYSLKRTEEGYFIESSLLDLANGLLFRSDNGAAMFVGQLEIVYVGWDAFWSMNFGLLFRADELARVFGGSTQSTEKLPRTSTQSLNKQLQVLGAMAQTMIESGSKGPSEDARLILRKLESKGFGDVVSQKTLTRYLKDAYEQM